MKRKVVGIVIFPEVEVLDFCGPYEVFSVVRLDEARRRVEPSPFQVLLVAETLAAVQTAGGMRVLPDCTLADCPQLDILLAPGGWGTRQQILNETLVSWLGGGGGRWRRSLRCAPAPCCWRKPGCWTAAGPPPIGLAGVAAGSFRL